MEEICKTVCEYYRVPLEQLFSRSRKSKLVEARRMAMLLMYKDLNKTHQQIANYFELERTNVTHHLTAIIDEIKAGVFKQSLKDYNILKNDSPKNKLFQIVDRVDELKTTRALCGGLSQDEELELRDLEVQQLNAWSAWKDLN